MRTVTVTDTLTGKRKALEPREPGKVGIYACGPTTYGPIHIGNARPYVVFMLFGRFLRRLGYEVRVVFNLTDVNDKIYAAAAEQGVPSADWASQMSEAYIHTTDRLGIGRMDRCDVRRGAWLSTMAGIARHLTTQGRCDVSCGTGTRAIPS